jgi:hypothetical protein
VSWYQLLDILKQADEEFEFYAERPPAACPQCGEPLRQTPTADSGSADELFCLFDGWKFPGDYVRPERL